MRLTKFWTMLFCMISCFVTAAVFFVEHQSKASANEIFGNMTYASNNPYWEPQNQNVTLSNGAYEWNYTSVDGAFVYYDLRYDHRYIYGDFNHDGLKDAAVIIIENEGGNTDWHTLAFLINDGKKFIHNASAVLDHGAIITSMRNVNDEVLIDMFVHQDGDSQAGPTKHVKRFYKYENGNRDIDGKELSAKSMLDPIIWMVFKEGAIENTLKHFCGINS